MRHYEPLTAGEFEALQGMVALMDREWRERNPAAAAEYDRQMAALQADYRRASSGFDLRTSLDAVKRLVGWSA